MGMTAREIWLSKSALKTLDDVGPRGITEEALLQQTEIQSQTLLTTIDKEALMKRLVNNNWANSFTHPLTGNIRWKISYDGKLALGAL